MKLNRLPRPAAALALLAAATLSVLAQSPVGSWDVLIKGELVGNGVITFNGDYSLAGYQITGYAVTPTPASDTSRAGVGGGRTGNDAGSDGSDTPTATNGVTTIIGGATLAGQWIYDRSGKKVLGFLTGTSRHGTNYFTNVVSFTASARGGKLKLVATAQDNSKVSYSGVPTATAPSIAGSYYANGTKDGVPFIEFFTLTKTGSGSNLYDFTGTGPDYVYNGSALLSVQRQLSIVTSNDDPTNEVIRSLSGKFDPNRGIGQLKGRQEPGSQILFRATKQ